MLPRKPNRKPVELESSMNLPGTTVASLVESMEAGVAGATGLPILKNFRAMDIMVPISA